MKKGLFGGTFDPIHFGHLKAADAARSALELDAVWFIPTGNPWMKDDQVITTREQREAMVDLAVAGNPRFSVLKDELRRPGYTYTVDTLSRLHEVKEPLEEFILILGSDAFLSLPQWKEPAKIMQMASFAVVARSGYDISKEGKLEAALPGVTEKMRRVEMSAVDISGEHIRKSVSEGQSIRKMVPKAVMAYIEEHGLYRKRED